MSLPAALAASLILERKLHIPGVHVPKTREIADPILAALEPMGLRFEEWTQPTDPRTPLLPR